MEAREQVTEVPGFGTVTHDRIRYNARLRWWGGGSVEDIPLRHITAVRLESVRRPLWGIVLILFGLIVLFAPGVGAKLIGLIILALSVYLLWPKPKVVVNTAGGDLRPSVGAPWTKPEAEKFVAAVRSQLFRDNEPQSYKHTATDAYRERPKEEAPHRQGTSPFATPTENLPKKPEVQPTTLENQHTIETPDVPLPPPPEVETFRFCANCGRKAQDGANFCPKCGRALRTQ